MRPVGFFALAAAGLILLLGALLALIFPGPESLRAVAIGAAIALPVQVIAFSILRSFRDQGPIVLTAWVIGSVLRLTVLVAYALLVVRPGALPAVPALVSLAVFLFATTVLEPLLLGRS